MSNSVLVLSSTNKPLMPCCPARARELLTKNKAAVFRQQPFTIILKDREDGVIQPLELKLDPGSKTTGIALVSKNKRGFKCLAGFNLIHRGQYISKTLFKRTQQRKSRRYRNTRYRKPRFNNRLKPIGWLPPSIVHRLLTTQTWIKRLIKWSPVSKIIIENVAFDIEKISRDVIYVDGTTLQYEIRQYILLLHNYTCQYCKGFSNDKSLEVEHILPKSKGGTNSLNNLTLSCKQCNIKKGNMILNEWKELLNYSNKPIDKMIIKNIDLVANNLKHSTKDMSIMNATKNKIRDFCLLTKIITETSSGAITNKNRTFQKYRKDHWIDAACVGSSGCPVYIPKKLSCLTVFCKGYGSRQMCDVDKFGFPRSKPKCNSRVFGFSSNDIVKTIKNHTGTINVRGNGKFNFIKNGIKKYISYRDIFIKQIKDGYSYKYGTSFSKTFIFDDDVENISKTLKNILNFTLKYRIIKREIKNKSIFVEVVFVL